ncbi:response regulator [Reinekea marinisedimentorum]|uniref:Tetratricopeptide repeat protein n=1 Tax=Reinekea marinisedimentorum TaxID=230495 RepID=A0A4R3I5Z3_9GAMM|nr:response regulator [Reinekea marinisedimentorum]TCS41319.1 tetratricopeptide repeat protein [Reinekea marinisedimentorum]
MEFSESQNLKALVVDDFATVRKSIKAMLLELGFQRVVEAFDAESATKAVSNSDFDLILCDYNLGKGRNGLRLLEEWRHEKLVKQGAVFVLITGDTSKQVVVSALEYQPDDYLAKPFTMDVLKVRIERWFERRKVMLPILVQREAKDWEAVAHSAMSVINKHPRYRTFAQKQYVESMMQRKRYSEAENFLHGLLEKRVQGWAQVELNRIAIERNQLTQAESALRKVILSEPNLTDAYDCLAVALDKLGKKEEQQFVIDQAVYLAPQNIGRLNRLIEVAIENHDFARASQALKELIALSAGTMHESIELYQRYIRSLTEEQDLTESKERKREINKEISTTSQRMKNRFGRDINVRLFNEAISVRSSAEPDSLKFTPRLNDLFAETLECLEEVNGLTALMVSSTYYRADRFADGDDLVRRFSKQFEDDSSILNELTDLQAEPVSLALRQQAHSLNLKGIELYETGEFGQAIEFFQKAMGLSPRHAGIILNFVQSYMKLMQQSGTNQLIVSKCREFLDRLEYLPKDHDQYSRYKKLDKRLMKLQEI